MRSLPPTDMTKYKEPEGNPQPQALLGFERANLDALVSDSVLGSTTIRGGALSILSSSSIKPYAPSLAFAETPLSVMEAISAAATAQARGSTHRRTPSLAYRNVSTSLLMASMNYDRAVVNAATERLQRLLHSRTGVTWPNPSAQTRNDFPSGI